MVLSDMQAFVSVKKTSNMTVWHENVEQRVMADKGGGGVLWCFF